MVPEVPPSRSAVGAALERRHRVAVLELRHAFDIGLGHVVELDLRFFAIIVHRYLRLREIDRNLLGADAKETAAGNHKLLRFPRSRIDDHVLYRTKFLVVLADHVLTHQPFGAGSIDCRSGRPFFNQGWRVGRSRSTFHSRWRRRGIAGRRIGHGITLRERGARHQGQGRGGADQFLTHRIAPFIPPDAS